jgi:predicted ATPase
MSHLPALHFELPPTSTVYRFALTGGPCGGKSTALVEVADRLRSLGYQVFVVPEQATIFHIAGVHYPAGQSDAATITWEASRILAQIAMEDAFARVAVATGKPTVILSDRGTMDTKAYMMEDKWQLMLDEMKWNVVALRDRYVLLVAVLLSVLFCAPYPDVRCFGLCHSLLL